MQVCGQLQSPVTLVPGMDNRVHWIGGCVGSEGSLDYPEKKKFLASVVIQTPDRPARKPSHCTGYSIPAGEESQLWILLTCKFFQLPVTSTLLGPTFPLNSQFSCASAAWQNKLQIQKHRTKLQFCMIGLYFIPTLLDNERERKWLRSG